MKKQLGAWNERKFKETLADMDAAMKGKRTKSFGPFEPVKRLSVKEVKAARAASNLSQTKFATALGLSPATVRAWEGGRRRALGLESKVLRAITKEPKFVAVLAGL